MAERYEERQEAKERYEIMKSSKAEAKLVIFLHSHSWISQKYTNRKKQSQNLEEQVRNSLK